MDRIEQAILTSAGAEGPAGPKLSAASPGVRSEDARELAAWYAAPESLDRRAEPAVGASFHPLPSGAFCISRTLTSGERVRRTRLTTQCLIVPPRVLARFANNPFAILRAAKACGLLACEEPLPLQLEPLFLPGEAPAVDARLLERLAVEPGAEWMASMVQAALDSVSIALAGGPADDLIAGLINCLPPACRLEFSFSTGLRFSSRRPFRIVALPGDEQEQRRVERLYNLAVLRPDCRAPDEFTPVDSWARLIQRVLRSGRIAYLARRLSGRQGCTPLEDLNVLGLELLEEFDVAAMDDEPTDESPAEQVWTDWMPEHSDLRDDRDGPTEAADDSLDEQDDAPAGPITRAHAAHRSPEDAPATKAAMIVKAAAPSKQLAPAHPQALHVLERLDDLVFASIAGQGDALEELKSYWPQVRTELDDALLAESREQYLRYALSLWEECVDKIGIRHAERAIQSLDVLCLLFDGA